MGTKSTRKTHGVSKWSVTPGTGPVAQVAHPVELDWTPRVAMDTLLAAVPKLPPSVHTLVTGGGFVSLVYPYAKRGTASVRQPNFLDDLHAWTMSELAGVIESSGKPEVDLVVGVDVEVNDRGSGQFALWLGGAGMALVPKRFPVSEEVRYLAGVDALQPGPYQRVVNTRLGPTLLLVCHDVQAFNRRNRANVRRAKQVTVRARAIKELDRARATRGLAWGLNVVHWIEGESNTRTFHTSYGQFRSDFAGNTAIAGGIGYSSDVAPSDLPTLLDRMMAPGTMSLPKIVIRN